MGTSLGLLVSLGLIYLLLARSCLSHAVADRRAKRLLRAVLSPTQSQQLQQRGFLDVPSPSRVERVYRIPGAGGLVRVYEQGHPLMDLCLQPIEPLPEADVVVLHLLLIQADEQAYLHQANQFAPGTFPLRGWERVGNAQERACSTRQEVGSRPSSRFRKLREG